MKTCALFLSLILSLTAFASDPQTLNIGMMSGWAPFMTITPKGEYSGFDVDVAHELGSKLNRKIKIIDLGSLAPLFIALQKNKIDMVFSGLDITQQRQKEYSMVAYTGTLMDSFSLLFWEKIPTDFKSLADFSKLPSPTVCVEPGSTSEKFLLTFPAVKPKHLGSVMDMVMDIKYAKSQAMIIEPLMAPRLLQKFPALKELRIPLPDSFKIHGMGIALKKDAPELTKQVTEAIKKLRDDGTMARLEKKWQLQHNEVKP
jgi:ABC-type amino acid transport substrate-binding protein